MRARASAAIATMSQGSEGVVAGVFQDGVEAEREEGGVAEDEGQGDEVVERG